MFLKTPSRIILQFSSVVNRILRKKLVLLKKQYQNLSYKIKEETEDGDNATVEVEIEVYDYITRLPEWKPKVETEGYYAVQFIVK